MGKREIESATRLLNEAVVRDPNFFAAYVLLAFCHDNYYWYGNDKSPARLELAQSALDQAQRIRPGAAELISPKRAIFIGATWPTSGQISKSRRPGNFCPTIRRCSICRP